jgi:hypothetical protein
MAFNRHHALANALATAFLLVMCIPAYVSDFVETNAEDNWTTNLSGSVADSKEVLRCSRT